MGTYGSSKKWRSTGELLLIADRWWIIIELLLILIEIRWGGNKIPVKNGVLETI